MTQILSLQVGDVIGTDDRSLKRADQGSDVSAFEGLLAPAPNLPSNNRLDDQMPLQTTEKLVQFQGPSQTQGLSKRQTKDRAVEEPPISAIAAGLGLPQHFANMGKTVALSHSDTPAEAPGSAAHSTTTAIAKTVKSALGIPSDVDIDNGLRHNDLSRFTVKVTDQQTHFAPVGGSSAIESNWAAMSAGQSVNTNASSNTDAATGQGRRTVYLNSRDALDTVRFRHDFSRITADVGRSGCVEGSSPAEFQSGANEFDAMPFRATAHSAQPTKDPIAGVPGPEPVIRELAAAQNSNQATAPLPSAASQVFSALFERAPAVDPAVSHLAPQLSSPLFPNHIGQSHLKTLTVELKPQDMGLVQVQMTSANGVLVIRLEVESSETLASLDAASAELASRITSGGLQLSELVISPLKADRPSEVIANGGSSVASGGSSGSGSEGKQGQAGRSADPRDEVATQVIPSGELGPKENSISNNIGIFSPGRRSWRV